MAATLSGRTIAFLATDGVEQIEMTEPWRAARGRRRVAQNLHDQRRVLDRRG